MQAPPIREYQVSDIKDGKVLNAIIMAEDAWNSGVPFSRAIIEASEACNADINKVADYMLQLAEKKKDESIIKKTSISA